MFRITRKRALLGGLAAVLAASTFGVINPSASARTNFGADRLERARGLAGELDAYIEAARLCDLEAARQAYQQAEARLHSFEVEVQFVANERWLEFDRIYFSEQIPASLGLGEESADDYTCEERVDLAEEAAGVWDSIVEYLAVLPEDSPAWGELHQLRSANQSLRLAAANLSGVTATPASPITEPDLVEAQSHALEFVADWPQVRPLVRNDELAAELDGLVAALEQAFTGDPAGGFPDGEAALEALSSRFGFAINLTDRAARNHKYNRPTWDPDAWEILDTSADEVLTIFEIRDRIALGTPEAAAEIVTEYNDWLQYSLSRKMASVTGAADSALTTAVNNYAAAQTPETAAALRDQLLLAEQVLVGQYWGTPELEAFYAENEAPNGDPGGDPGEEPGGVQTFVAALTPENNIPPGPPGATGDATIEIDVEGGQVCHLINYENVGAPLTMSHIHIGDPGTNGPVVVNFTNLASGARDCVAADPQLLTEIVANPGGYYVNLHTDPFPQGVLRGPLEPAS